MTKLIIDAANKNIFLMIINNNDIYSISHENIKTNYEKLIILINDFLNSKNLKIKDISKLVDEMVLTSQLGSDGSGVPRSTHSDANK